MTQQIVKRVAVNTRALRAHAGLSLSELARRAGLSKGALSQLEAGHGNPTVETLWAVAQALDVPFSDLTADTADPEVVVVRATDGDWIDGTPIASRLLHRASSPAVAEIHQIQVQPAGPRRSQPHPRGLIEHVVLHAGRIRVGPVQSPVVLAAGDAASYRADVEHVYEALDPHTAGIIVMSYPPASTSGHR